MTAVDDLRGLRGEFADFCRRHGIRRISVFGSALRDELDADSDLDLVVEYRPDRVPGMLGVASMELELEKLVGREVELRTLNDLSTHFRDQVREDASEIYAA